MNVFRLVDDMRCAGGETKVSLSESILYGLDNRNGTQTYVGCTNLVLCHS